MINNIFINEHIDIDGRSVAVASVDPKRAPHIVRGFELYATGQYTAREVVDMLNTAGLRTRGTLAEVQEKILKAIHAQLP